MAVNSVLRATCLRKMMEQEMLSLRRLHDDKVFIYVYIVTIIMYHPSNSSYLFRFFFT